MKIERTWAMPSAWTFTIKPIANLLQEEGAVGLMKQGLWADPFAGMNSPADHTNDLNPNMNATSHIDALDFMKSLKTENYDGVLYDPPYSLRQLSEVYQSVGLHAGDATKASYFSQIKDNILRVLKPGGKAICFGWNSMGLGKKRGFEMMRILLVAHGGSKNDTICTVEIKSP